MDDWLMLHCFALQGSSAPDTIPFVMLLAGSVTAGICTVIAGAKLRSSYKPGWLLITSGILRAIFVFPPGRLFNRDDSCRRH